MKVLLFDVDGTLIRAGGAGRRALNAAARELYGARDACSELSLAGRTDLYNFHAAYRKAAGRRATRRELERLQEAYLSRLPRFVNAARREGRYEVPEGLPALLKRLSRDPGILLGLGTGNLERGARIKLEPSGFNPYFRFGGFGSDALHRAALLRKAAARARRLARGRVSPRDVFVIGDTPFDVAAGREAGFRTVAVGTGFSEWKDLRAAKPDHLARDYRDLAAWLGIFSLK